MEFVKNLFNVYKDNIYKYFTREKDQFKILNP